MCEGFPIRRENDGIHDGRKLFAKGFLHGMRMMESMTAGKLFAKGFLFGVETMVYIATGNCMRKVSYSAWDGWYSC